ncbi:MAG: 2'-5' RNA ligase [Chloroflexota bacterium]|nr:2'-5' RNA ligase [Chloroflexota bacterium]
MIDRENLARMIAQRYISVQKHPTLDLSIYNYTDKAQYARVWNPETLACRGLIMDGAHHVVARPFPKFFNYAELVAQGAQLPAEEFTVTEKVDGSLGILYFDGEGQPTLATRGSFTSAQALRGTHLLRSKYGDVAFERAYTYLFEIIYPENRIVVDYGTMEDVVLLAAIHTESGREVSYDALRAMAGPLPVVTRYDGIRDVDQLAAMEKENREGFVVFFRTGERFKVKFAEYVRLHRLVTGTNARAIWDVLRHHQSFDDLLERVPDEFYRWVATTKGALEGEYAARLTAAERIFADLAARSASRKGFAAEAVEHGQMTPLLFALYDRKPVEEMIWKQLKPAAERPFTEEI